MVILMTVRKEIDFDKGLTPEQMKMLEEMETAPIEFDEDCPELTEEQLKSFKRVLAENRIDRNKQTVTIRLSPKALRTARSLGKGYTSVLSRILERTLSDSETLKHYL